MGHTDPSPRQMREMALLIEARLREEEAQKMQGAAESVSAGSEKGRGRTLPVDFTTSSF